MSTKVYGMFETLLEELKASNNPSQIVHKLQQIEFKLHINPTAINVIVDMGYADYFCQAISPGLDEFQLDLFLKVLVDLSYADGFSMSNHSRLDKLLTELIIVIDKPLDFRTSTSLYPSILKSSFWIISNVLKTETNYRTVFSELCTKLIQWVQCIMSDRARVFRMQLLDLIDTMSCSLTWEDFDIFGDLAKKLVNRDLLCIMGTDTISSTTCRVVYNLIRQDYRRTLILFPWLLDSLPELLEITVLIYHQRSKDEFTPFYILRSLSSTDDAIAEQLIDSGCLQALNSALSSREPQLQLDVLFVLSNFYLCKEYNIPQRMIEKGCFSEFNCASQVINRIHSVLLEVFYMANSLFWNSNPGQLNQLDGIGVIDFVLDVMQTMTDCPEKRKFSDSIAVVRAVESCAISFPLLSQKILSIRNYSKSEIETRVPTKELKYLSLGPESIDEIMGLSKVEMK